MNTVVIVGASPKPERYAYKAMQALQIHGITPVLVSNKAGDIEGLPIQQLQDISASVDTVTMYVNPELGLQYLPAIKQLEPKRVILNPGTRSDQLQHQLEAFGIEVVNDCTLLMLERGDF